MSEIKSYRDLLVWQKGMELVKQVYSLSRRFPDEERYGLVSQLRRAAVSIPSNIAEGYGRNSTQDYVRFLRMAIGSLYETQTQLEIAKGEGYFRNGDECKTMNAAEELEKMLISMAGKVENSGRKI